MRIGIITLPLHTNYGGLLQAYALKTVLESQGHDAVVLDIAEKMPAPRGLKAPLVYAGRMIKRIVKGTAGPEVFRERRYKKELPVVGAFTSQFVDEYIRPRVIKSFSDIRKGEFDAFVVGSDQVWRPRYFPKVENAFLAFAKGWDVRRVAYAASFGTERLEYEYAKLEECSALLKSFDGVSVREDKGVQMCSEWFDYEDAVHVLDPVMLLSSDVYRNIASKSADHPAAGKIMTYILDNDAHKNSIVEFMSRVSGKDVCDMSVCPYDKSVPLQERVVPPVERWLAGFADADFIVTDSFHGCVLSVLMHKPFIALGNPGRGMARLRSLLEMAGLDMRLVHGIDPEDDGEYFLSHPDWETVDARISEMKERSFAFLAKNL